MTWKKIIVSGSAAELGSLAVDGNITGTFIGALSSSAQIASDISGSLSAESIADLGIGIVSSSEQLPAGIVSSSAQLPSGIISSSVQLPSGIVSSSAQSIANLPSGTISGSEQLPSGIISSSTQLPSGIISSSAQIDSDLFDIDGLVSSSAQTVALLVNQDVDLGTGDITATQFVGDGSQLTNIDIAQAATVVSDFTSQTSVTVSHNFGTKNIMVTVYDDNDYQILPSEVHANTDNTVVVTFASATTGTAIVGKGGHVVSGSIPFDNLLNIPTLVSSSAQVKDLLPSSTVSGSSIASSNQGEVALSTNGVAATAIDLGLQTSDSPTFAGLTLTNNASVGGNLTITGDLRVDGATTTINTANLLVEDKFILLSSGSGAASEGGIIVDGGSDGGKGYGYDTDEGRWGFESGLADSANAIAPSAFAVQVVDIDAGNTDIPEYQKNGNIKTDSGAIWIYS